MIAQHSQNLSNDLARCEVALYAEFGFEGAVIANNTIDGAAIGVAVTNFNQGGRLAVVQGNLIRNLVPKRPVGTDPNAPGYLPELAIRYGAFLNVVIVFIIVAFVVYLITQAVLPEPPSWPMLVRRPRLRFALRRFP